MKKGVVDKLFPEKMCGRVKIGKKCYNFIYPEQDEGVVQRLAEGLEVEFSVNKMAEETRAIGLSIPGIVVKPDRPKPASYVQTGANEQPPYDFIKIPVDDKGEPAAVIDEPVYHDGIQNRDKEKKLLSGEFLCTLEALTPLIVGNYQYQVSAAGVPPAFETSPKKKILEPLRLPDGRVLISGASLKGMLRQSLGALLGAPMERVSESTYSYRPNIAFAPKNMVRLESRPAIVISGDRGKRLLQIKVLPDPKSANFRDQKGNPHNYAGGIDGSGKLAATFQRKMSVYRQGFVDSQSPGAVTTLTVPTEVLEHYERTQEHLADTETGHLRNSHPQSSTDASKLRLPKGKTLFQAVSDDVKKSAGTIYEKDQLIYVEVLMDRNRPQKVVSIGHHFRYRWRYVDSVREKWDKSSGSYITRPILRPLDCEKGEKPKELSGARLFFGYVSDSDDKQNKKDQLADIGSGDHQTLAGRIAINMAVEVCENPADDGRFLNSDDNCFVPLKVLGAPRSSAVKHYLEQDQAFQRQDRADLITYGDLLNDDPPGELKGRKFYLHQPDAASDKTRFETQDQETRKSDQAIIARFISQPKTKFKFTLRFSNLRPWELGAIMLVLQPERMEALAKSNDASWKGTADYVDNLKNDSGRQEMFALKLGHGRPLGLGSVKISLDGMSAWQEHNLETLDPEISFKEGLLDLRKKLNDMAKNRTILQWLEIHRYQGRARYDYPEENGEIFNYYTNLMKNHARNRRMK